MSGELVERTRTSASFVEGELGRTPDPMAHYANALVADAREAATLIETQEALIGEARWLFAQIGQMHSADHGDIAERCMALGQKGYQLLKARALIERERR